MFYYEEENEHDHSLDAHGEDVFASHFVLQGTLELVLPELAQLVSKQLVQSHLEQTSAQTVLREDEEHLMKHQRLATLKTVMTNQL